MEKTASLSNTSGDVLAELDAPLLSLLDVIRKKAESMGLLEKIHRVMVAVKYGKKSEIDALRESIESSIEAEQAADERNGVISGILLMYPVCCVLLIEGPNPLILGCLRKIKEIHERSPDVVASLHMLISIPDAPGRSFPFFFAKTLQNVISKAEPPTFDKDQLVNIIPDISVNLQKIGKELEQLSEDEQSRNIDSFQRHYDKHLPRPEDLLGLCASEDVLSFDVRRPGASAQPARPVRNQPVNNHEQEAHISWLATRPHRVFEGKTDPAFTRPRCLPRRRRPLLFLAARALSPAHAGRRGTCSRAGLLATAACAGFQTAGPGRPKEHRTTAAQVVVAVGSSSSGRSSRRSPGARREYLDLYYSSGSGSGSRSSSSSSSSSWRR